MVIYLPEGNLIRSDLFRLTIFNILSLGILCWSSLFIRIIDHEGSYIPTGLDYFRVFLLASLSSIGINYTYKYFSKETIIFKVFLEFLALLLLSYPQKTEISHTQSEWNLVKRESYLFGIFVQACNVIFYLSDIWDRSQSLLLNTASNDSDDTEEFSEFIRQKSTLANCIEIRKKTKSLKKNIYSNVHTAELGSEYSDNYPISQHQYDNYGSYSNTVSDRDIIGYTDQEKLDQKSYFYTVSISIYSPQKPELFLFYQLISIVITTMYEIGISLILSVTFIYVPEVGDEFFTQLERYYYNKVGKFIIQIVIPLSLINLLVQYLLNIKKLSEFYKLTTLFAVSIILFVGGINVT